MFSNFANEVFDIDFSNLISVATFFLSHKVVAVVIVVEVVVRHVAVVFFFDLSCNMNLDVHACFIVINFVMHHVDQIRIFFDF